MAFRGYTGPMRGNRSNVTNRRGGALANFANRGSTPMRETNIRGGAVPNFRTVTNVKGGAVPTFSSKSPALGSFRSTAGSGSPWIVTGKLS